MHAACCSYVLYSGCEKRLLDTQVKTTWNAGTIRGKRAERGNWKQTPRKIWMTQWQGEMFPLLCSLCCYSRRTVGSLFACFLLLCLLPSTTVCSPTFPCVLNAVFSVQYTYSFRVLRVFLLSFNMQCFLLECSVCSCNVLYSLCSLMLSLVFCVFWCSQLILDLFLCAPGFSVFLRF
jgi:hypothetical protein